MQFRKNLQPPTIKFNLISIFTYSHTCISFYRNFDDPKWPRRIGLYRGFIKTE